MSDVPVFLALAAGVLAAVNPCGFALLPAYLSLLVVGEEPLARTAAVGRAIALTAAMTVGFVGVFGLFGLVLVPAMALVQRDLPWFTIGLGLALAVLGGWLVAGRQLPALPWKLSRAPTLTRAWGSMALFGAAYALASLSCTIGPFLAIVVSSARGGSALAGLALFGAYALGMGLVVGTLALAVALTRASLVSRLRRTAAGLSRAAGALLVLTGAYVAWYGWYEIKALSGRPVADPIVAAGTTAQHRLAGWLDGIGVLTIAVTFSLLLVAALVAGRVHGHRTGDRKKGFPVPR
jgi:cytochrome c biogenesis protein CcdA